MKKILCINLRGNPSCLGGVETFERNLKKMFLKELFLISYKTNKLKYYKVEDLMEIDTESLKFFLLRKIFRKNRVVKKIFSKLEYDIYILNSPKELIYLKKNSNTILVQHTMYEKYMEMFFKENELIDKCKQELKYFVFLSKYDKEKFVKNLNFPIEKAKVIRHSSEIELLTGKKIRNKNLIIISRLKNNEKRIDLAIKSMRKLKDFILNIYGDGEDKKYLEDLIKENNLKNVILHGGTNQVKEKLDENGIFIMTSDYEGYGITNIEAMRRGLPIILRNTFDSAPDIVQDNGVLLEKEWDEDKFVEAVRKVYDNYEYYSENSIKMGKRHDFEVIKKEWNKLFESL